MGIIERIDELARKANASNDWGKLQAALNERSALLDGNWPAIRAVLIAAKKLQVIDRPCPCGFCGNTTMEVECTQTELGEFSRALAALEEK